MCVGVNGGLRVVRGPFVFFSCFVVVAGVDGLGGIRRCVVGGGGGRGRSGWWCSRWGWRRCVWWWGCGDPIVESGVLWVGVREGVVEVDDLVWGPGFLGLVCGVVLAYEDGVHVIHVLACLV